MDKQKLQTQIQNYINELKEKSQMLEKSCQRQVEEIKNQSPDKKIMTFTIAEHLYLVSKNLNHIVNELEQIVKEEEKN